MRDVNRTARIFLAALLCSTAMLATAGAIRPSMDGSDLLQGLLRFLLISGGAAAALAAWATAVFAATRHVTWPLVVAMATLVAYSLALVLS